MFLPLIGKNYFMVPIYSQFTLEIYKLFRFIDTKLTICKFEKI